MQSPFIILKETPVMVAATTQRGDSAADANPYSGFSLCHYTGDTPEQIAACRAELCHRFGIEESRLYVPRQTHSTRVLTLTEENADDTRPDSVDAIVTTMHAAVIGVNTADCLPVLLYDEEAEVIAAAHAGWRGAVKGILGDTIKAMEAVGASAARIRAIVCPAICVDCFEVGEEVAEQFPASCVKRIPGSKPHVNLPQFAREALMEAGLHDANITLTGACTRCNPRRYFSARRLGINSGRNYSFIMLK